MTPQQKSHFKLFRKTMSEIARCPRDNPERFRVLQTRLVKYASKAGMVNEDANKIIQKMHEFRGTVDAAKRQEAGRPKAKDDFGA